MATTELLSLPQGSSGESLWAVAEGLSELLAALG